MKPLPLSPRESMFVVIAWVIFVAGIIGIFLLAALTESATASDIGLWIGLALMFVGPPLLVAIASLVIFGARGRIKNAFGVVGCGAGVLFFAIMCVAVKPGMLHGARKIVFGSASGSPSQIAATDAAWVDVSPAFVDITRLGYATSTTTDSKGKSSTSTRGVAPILTAHGEADPAALAAERVALFVCLSDRDDVVEAARGNGTISGRMHRADFLELQAMDNANVTNRLEAPRCVVPGRGASVFWIVLWIVVILVGSTGGAAIVTAVAAPRRR